MDANRLIFLLVYLIVSGLGLRLPHYYDRRRIGVFPSAQSSSIQDTFDPSERSHLRVRKELSGRLLPTDSASAYDMDNLPTVPRSSSKVYPLERYRMELGIPLFHNSPEMTMIDHLSLTNTVADLQRKPKLRKALPKHAFVGYQRKPNLQLDLSRPTNLAEVSKNRRSVVYRPKRQRMRSRVPLFQDSPELTNLDHLSSTETLADLQRKSNLRKALPKYDILDEDEAPTNSESMHANENQSTGPRSSSKVYLLRGYKMELGIPLFHISPEMINIDRSSLTNAVADLQKKPKLIKLVPKYAFIGRRRKPNLQPDLSMTRDSSEVSRKSLSKVRSPVRPGNKRSVFTLIRNSSANRPSRNRRFPSPRETGSSIAETSTSSRLGRRSRPVQQMHFYRTFLANSPQPKESENANPTSPSNQKSSTNSRNEDEMTSADFDVPPINVVEAKKKKSSNNKLFRTLNSQPSQVFHDQEPGNPKDPQTLGGRLVNANTPSLEIPSDLKETDRVPWSQVEQPGYILVEEPASVIDSSDVSIPHILQRGQRKQRKQRKKTRKTKKTKKTKKTRRTKKKTRRVTKKTRRTKKRKKHGKRSKGKLFGLAPWQEGNQPHIPVTSGPESPVSIFEYLPKPFEHGNLLKRRLSNKKLKAGRKLENRDLMTGASSNDGDSFTQSNRNAEEIFGRMTSLRTFNEQPTGRNKRIRSHLENLPEPFEHGNLLKRRLSNKKLKAGRKQENRDLMTGASSNDGDSFTQSNRNGEEIFGRMTSLRTFNEQPTGRNKRIRSFLEHLPEPFKHQDILKRRRSYNTLKAGNKPESVDFTPVRLSNFERMKLQQANRNREKTLQRMELFKTMNGIPSDKSQKVKAFLENFPEPLRHLTSGEEIATRHHLRDSSKFGKGQAFRKMDDAVVASTNRDLLGSLKGPKTPRDAKLPEPLGHQSHGNEPLQLLANSQSSFDSELSSSVGKRKAHSQSLGSKDLNEIKPPELNSLMPERKLTRQTLFRSPMTPRLRRWNPQLLNSDKSIQKVEKARGMLPMVEYFPEPLGELAEGVLF